MNKEHFKFKIKEIKYYRRERKAHEDNEKNCEHAAGNMLNRTMLFHGNKSGRRSNIFH